jgi:hypothetical protein
MALTEASAAQRAFLFLQQKNIKVDANFIPRAVASLPDALRNFAERVARFDDDLSELLRKDFAVTLVAGSPASLATHTNGTEPMLPDHIVKVTFPGQAYELHRLSDEADLDRPWPTTWAYYAVFGNKIGTRDTDGALNTFDGTATVRASYVPAIGNVPTQLHNLLIEVLASYGAPAAPAAATK